MMFLSGTFFPRFAMPNWLQNVSGYLPLTPVIDGIRLIATEGKHVTDIGQDKDEAEIDTHGAQDRDGCDPASQASAHIMQLQQSSQGPTRRK